MEYEEEDYYQELFNEWMLDHQRNVDELPRGHSKTEFGVWFTIWLAVGQVENPWSKMRIREQNLIACEGKAIGLLGNRVKHFFYSNPKLSRYKPAGASQNKMVTGWDKSEMYLTNGSIIHLRTISGNIRGTHNDRVWADDLITEDSTLTDKQTVDKWDGGIDGITTVKKAMVQVTGTPLRASDILEHLKTKKGYKFRKRPAIINDATKEILGKKRWTYEQLMETKARIGSSKFGAEYMLQPIDDGTSMIKRAWVVQNYDERHTRSRHRGHYDQVYLGWDFAFSDKATADYAAGIIVGKYGGKFHLIEYVRYQGKSGPEQLDIITQLHAQYKFDYIGLEENSIKAITKEVKRLGLPIKLFNTSTMDEKDKKKPDFTGTVSVGKRNLIFRLATTLENHGLVLPFESEQDRDLMRTLTEELTSFALEEGKVIELGVHPDGPIALGYALEVATKNSWIIDKM